jgi:hypothetical protein
MKPRSSNSTINAHRDRYPSWCLVDISNRFLRILLQAGMTLGVSINRRTTSRFTAGLTVPEVMERYTAPGNGALPISPITTHFPRKITCDE